MREYKEEYELAFSRKGREGERVEYLNFYAGRFSGCSRSAERARTHARLLNFARAGRRGYFVYVQREESCSF